VAPPKYTFANPCETRLLGGNRDVEVSFEVLIIGVETVAILFERVLVRPLEVDGGFVSDCTVETVRKPPPGCSQ
jgi:hypothetical protein